MAHYIATKPGNNKPSEVRDAATGEPPTCPHSQPAARPSPAAASPRSCLSAARRSQCYVSGRLECRVGDCRHGQARWCISPYMPPSPAPPPPPPPPLLCTPSPLCPSPCCRSLRGAHRAELAVPLALRQAAPGSQALRTATLQEAGSRGRGQGASRRLCHHSGHVRASPHLPRKSTRLQLAICMHVTDTHADPPLPFRLCTLVQPVRRLCPLRALRACSGGQRSLQISICAKPGAKQKRVMAAAWGGWAVR